ncbi:adult-specific rigid cuticular protein 15.7-like [Uloborus diversus]|uniref:adult-specific rigid cuticular protein 15.7-like n=1 Tax=Uloborus diversus TaxID=327109 RepID=UPI0024091DBE|nr:adult-specific rigid cuticular protein 15.7-like [Uloborus diversus]
MFSQVTITSKMSSFALHFNNPMHHAPKPYKFGYNIKDKHGDQYREEVGDGASGVKGSYGFTDARGIHRRVDYVADHAGFRAQVKTNEPGTANQDPAAVKMISSAPYAGPESGFLGAGIVGAPVVLGAPGIVGVNGLGLGYERQGYAELGYGGLGYGGLGYGAGLLGGLGYARYGY